MDGALMNVGYFGGIDNTATSLVATDSKWPLVTADFTRRAWSKSTNPYSGYLDYSPTMEDIEMTGASITWSLFQPKW